VSQQIRFPRAGAYQIYARLRIGPGGGSDDSFFLNLPTDGEPNWQSINAITGYDVEGTPNHRPGAMVGVFGGNAGTGVWKWSLFDSPRIVVPDGQLTQTFSFATREDGLDIDKFAFALEGEEYAVGFTTEQLDAGQAGVLVPVTKLPDPYEPPADQPPLVVGATKWLGMVCCGNQRQSLENYFNQITPENGGKWGTVESVRDEYNWTGADEALAVAEENDFPFRYHVLLWGSQQPDWIEELPPEEQLAEIRQWFEAVSERYGDRINLLEVVNEFDNQPPTAEHEGHYIDALGGTGESGFDWVITAFRMAREIFPPSVKLMLNEYSVINTQSRTDLYVRVAERLKQENLIDALGEQAHAFSTHGPVEEMIGRINQLGSTGLPLYLTEMDVDGPPGQQLIDVQRLFPPLWENPNVHGITLWGFRDGMWRTPNQATLVYGNGAEKPALRWLKGYFHGNAPQVAGPASATLPRAARKGTRLATFSVSGPDGAAYPEGTDISWGVAQSTAMDDAVVGQSLAFAAGTARLELVTPLPPGSYRARIYADVNAVVSNLFDVEITVE
jgi:endo-1,4-beta-xylanase